MPRGGWGKRISASLATWLAAAIAILSIGGGIGYGLFQQSAYEQSAKEDAADYAKHAANQINQSCAGVAKSELPICVAKEKSEYYLKTRDNRRDYADLVAQRKSALWTFVMGVAALIGMGLSVVGVFLVYTTFHETRKANSISRESVYRQLRAYVTIDGSEHRHKDGWDWVTLTLHNSGSTPATRVKIVSTMFQVEDCLFVEIPIETTAHDIGGQSKIIQDIKWYDWTKRTEARLPRPNSISGKVVYSACIPDEFGQILSYEIDFELVPASAKVSDSRMGLPGNNYF
jgi:hypothetical protein